jgi:tripartite-type tricarboxylate transporter receptor subunit TctC
MPASWSSGGCGALTGSKFIKRRSFLGLTASGALGPLAVPRVASAQSGAWPTRGSIRLVVQFPPGGLVDTGFVAK